MQRKRLLSASDENGVNEFACSVQHTRCRERREKMNERTEDLTIKGQMSEVRGLGEEALGRKIGPLLAASPGKEKNKGKNTIIYKIEAMKTDIPLRNGLGGMRVNKRRETRCWTCSEWRLR